MKQKRNRDKTELATLRQVDIAYAFGVSTTAVRNWLGCPRNPDGSYNLRDVIAWKQRRDAAAIEAKYKSDLTEYTGALERTHKLRGDLLEMDLAERHGQVLRAETVNNLLASFSTLIRKAGNKLRKKYDNRAGEILEDAIDRCEAEVKRFFEEQRHIHAAPERKKKS